MANQECDCLQNEDELQSLLDDESHIYSDVEDEKQIESGFENVVEVSRAYKGLETEDIKIEVDNAEYTISATLQKMWYESVYDFPSVGSENIIYGAKDTKTLYTWDNEGITYIRLMGDWNEIEVIDGGNA